jgi:membrane protein YdbS with pleckstrin-like domain
MQKSRPKWITRGIVIVLLLIGFRIISLYYFSSPTYAILAIVGLIVLTYLVVFFKEIFRRKRR